MFFTGVKKTTPSSKSPVAALSVRWKESRYLHRRTVEAAARNIRDFFFSR